MLHGLPNVPRSSSRNKVHQVCWDLGPTFAHGSPASPGTRPKRCGEKAARSCSGGGGRGEMEKPWNTPEPCSLTLQLFTILLKHPPLPAILTASEVRRTGPLFFHRPSMGLKKLLYKYIYIYIDPRSTTPNVGKYASPMDVWDM